MHRNIKEPRIEIHYVCPSCDFSNMRVHGLSKKTAVVSSPLIEHNSSWMLPAQETNTHLTSLLLTFFGHIHSADLHLPKVTRTWFLKRIKAHSKTALEGHSGHFKSHQSYRAAAWRRPCNNTANSVVSSSKNIKKHVFICLCVGTILGLWWKVTLCEQGLRFACKCDDPWISCHRVTFLVSATWYDRTRTRFQIEGYFHRHVIVPSLSKLSKRSSSCRRHIATTLPPHLHHIAATSPPLRCHMAATWPPHGRHMAATWPPHGRHIAATVAAMWRQCGGDVAAMWRQCGGDVAAMWRQCGGDVMAMWWQCVDNAVTLCWQSRDNLVRKTMIACPHWDKAEELRSWKLYAADKYLHCKFGKLVLLTLNQKAQQIHRHVHSQTLGAPGCFQMAFAYCSALPLLVLAWPKH